jgi:hypothetical protein
MTLKPRMYRGFLFIPQIRTRAGPREPSLMHVSDRGFYSRRQLLANAAMAASRGCDG